jgi:hypothetical protein
MLSLIKSSVDVLVKIIGDLNLSNQWVLLSKLIQTLTLVKVLQVGLLLLLNNNNIFKMMFHVINCKVNCNSSNRSSWLVFNKSMVLCRLSSSWVMSSKLLTFNKLQHFLQLNKKPLFRIVRWHSSCRYIIILKLIKPGIARESPISHSCQKGLPSFRCT